MEDKREIFDNSSAVPVLIDDVVFDIFSRLPVKSLIQYTSVSKPFYSLIKNPSCIDLHLAKTFIQNHKDRLFIFIDSHTVTRNRISLYKFDPAAKTIVKSKMIKFPFEGRKRHLEIAGSSNGLVCFFGSNILFLWNPILGKTKVVECSHATKGTTHFEMIFGFAFVSEITDFKIVQISYGSDADWDADVFVYTLGGNFWRQIDTLVPCDIPNCSSNVFVDGSIHWIASERWNGDESSHVPDRIMLFNLSNEVFGEFMLPNINIDTEYLWPQLSASCGGDSLSLFLYCYDRWEVWPMKKYGVVESWVKQYNIVEPEIQFPLRFMDNGDILVLGLEGSLAFFDPENKDCKDTDICGPIGSISVVGCIQSIALLN